MKISFSDSAPSSSAFASSSAESASAFASASSSSSAESASSVSGTWYTSSEDSGMSPPALFPPSAPSAPGELPLIQRKLNLCLKVFL